MAVEGRIPAEVRAALEARGHEVEVAGEWSNGQVVAVRFDADTGLISGAASPRGVSYCVGW
jgi:gamma-glutamyltranspeptidase / glutathione hydrolase